MLIGQASINFSANILSAVLGLLSVFVFTRLFSPHDYGVYLLGVGFAAVVSVFLVGWFRNLILSGHARNDGTDVRGLVMSGYLLCCLTAPIAYGLGRLVGLDTTAALAAVVLSVAIGLFELTQDLVRARLMALSVMKATLVRAAAVLGLGVVVARVGAADAGKYVASLDLVRQTLMMPAMSAAAAFFPLAVQIHAGKGDTAVRAH